MASTAAWIWLCGIDGSKIRTFGPRSADADGLALGPAACTDGATARRAMTARLAIAARRLRLGRGRRREPPDGAFDHVVIASPLPSREQPVLPSRQRWKSGDRPTSGVRSQPRRAIGDTHPRYGPYGPKQER